jgi:pectate lyase
VRACTAVTLSLVALLRGAPSCDEFDYDLGGAGVAGSPGSAGASNAGVVGWAAASDCGPEGTTGGGDGTRVLVQSASELAEALNGDGPAVVEVAGRIELGTETLVVTGSDKTLVGTDSAELVGAFKLDGSRNVIIRNIKFNGGSSSEYDAMELSGATCVWLDHSEFFDGGDAILDIVRGSDFITVSWSKFYNVLDVDDHRLGSLCGGDDTDTPGRLNVTYHHNFWGEGVLEQMPRVRHGKVHIFNNVYASPGNSYCIGAGYMSKLLVENNFFDAVTDPIRFQVDQDTAEVVETGNEYSNTNGDSVSRGAAFTPPYSYELDTASEARDAVIAQAGAH